ELFYGWSSSFPLPISNFKHSTGLFELALLYSAGVTCSASAISNLAQSYKLSAAIEANLLRPISNLQRFPKPLERVLKVN
ncbi:TPA: hypothetical protein ACGOVY_000986, partial [Streptococcus suis]